MLVNEFGEISRQHSGDPLAVIRASQLLAMATYGNRKRIAEQQGHTSQAYRIAELLDDLASEVAILALHAPKRAAKEHTDANLRD